jgi:hypothetical protein
MLHALQRYRDSYQFTVEIVDVDADAALIDKFDELVPVLFGESKEQAPVQLCHYFLDAETVEQFLRQ